MYETGQAIRYDARDHLLWLVALPAFQMARRSPHEIDRCEPLPPLVSYGWHHVPSGVRNRDRLVDRPLQTARRKIAAVLPPTMRCLAEPLSLPAPGQLEAFAERVGVRPGRRLRDAGQIASLQAAIERRLTDQPRDSDRKTLERRLRDIDPVACWLPIDSLEPSLVEGEPVAVNATAAYLEGRIVGAASASTWPMIGRVGENGIEPNDPPPPISEFRFVKSLDSARRT